MIAQRPGPPTRNGLPPTRPYRWRAPRLPWMAAALATAEREHGPPVPTCLCGHRLIYRTRTGTRAYARCRACGRCAYTGP